MLIQINSVHVGLSNRSFKKLDMNCHYIKNIFKQFMQMYKSPNLGILLLLQISYFCAGFLWMFVDLLKQRRAFQDLGYFEQTWC